MDRVHFLLRLFLLSMLCTCIMAQGESLYSSKYDGVDVDLILSNARLRNQYLSCYLGKGPCITPDAKFFRDKFPEALVTKCRRCTSKQKNFFEKITVWYTENEPDTWDRVLRKSIQDFQNRRNRN